MLTWPFNTGEHLRADRKGDATNADAESFHPERLRYWSMIVLQLSVAALCEHRTQERAISKQGTIDRGPLRAVFISMSRHYRIQQDHERAHWPIRARLRLPVSLSAKHGAARGVSPVARESIRFR